MKGWRLFLLSFLLCLPALLIVGVGTYFILTEVPRAVRRESLGIGREYREIAEDFIAHPEKATYVGARMKGWRQSNRINGIFWGFEDGIGKDGLKTRIWFKAGEKEWRAIEVDAIRPFPYEMVFYGGGLLVSLVLLWLSGHAVRFMVRSMRSRDDFLAAAAHDLTTPLVGLRMTIGRDDEEARRLNERMLVIVNNLKDFLRLGGKRKTPARERFDLVEVCREAYGLFREDYRDLFGGEDVAIVAETAAEVVADRTLVVQILWNLFGNDLKYAAPYGKVMVRIVRERGLVRAEFADEGQGMTPRQMRRAFDRYYRAATALTSGKGGFGIGLCTAREMARAMGGDLTVRANVPTGCVFALSLPAGL